MAAGQGFKTFATGDVLTAADTNGYLMQGVWVFANSTARDAAVTSPQEGNTCYLKDTDQILVYSGSAWVVKSGGSSPLTTKGDLYTYSTADARLGVGTNGQVLTADSTAATGIKWATGSSGGMTLLSTTSLSGSSTSISVGGGYKNLQIYVKDFYASSAADITMRINSDTTASNYHQLVLRAAGSIQSYVTNAADGFDVAGYQTGTSQADNFTQVTIYDYDQATTKKAVVASGGVINGASTKTSFLNTGTYQGTIAAVTNVTFVTNGGTFSAGSVEIYGVK